MNVNSVWESRTELSLRSTLLVRGPRGKDSMEKIASFTVDHMKLLPGLYVSRKDPVGNTVVTTFDIRITKPNREPVMNTAEVHTIEHLGATFLRNHPYWGPRTVYFGPMGCRTGFYMVLSDDYSSRDVLPMVREMFEFIRTFEGQVPGQDPKECGNWLDMNLPMAHIFAAHYLSLLPDDPETPDNTRLVYPE